MYGDRYVAVSNAEYTKIQVKRSDISSTCTNVLNRQSGSAVAVTDGTATTPTTTNSTTNTGTATSGTTNVVTDLSKCPTVNATTDLGTGKFDATGTPISMDVGAYEGYIQPDSSHYARYGVIKSTSTADKYDIWLILDPTSSLFASSLQGAYATVHYIAPTTNNADTAAAALPLTRSMTAADSSSTARQWKFGQVRVPSTAGFGMRFSFTYKLTTSDVIMTPTFYFQPTTAAASTGTTTTTTPTTSTGTGTTSTGGVTTTVPISTEAARLAKWLGTFKVDSRCIKSDQCCCATDNIVAEAVTGSPGLVRLKSKLDGSQTCGGMTDVTGDFTITSDTTATYTYPDTPLVLSAGLSTDGNELSFSNNMYTCKSYAQRIATTALPSSMLTATSSTSTGTSTTSSASSVNRENFVGQWVSDNSCKPSTNCCCMVGSMHVLTPDNARALSTFQAPTDTSLMTDPRALYAYGKLDGGIACFRRTDMAGMCVIDSTSQGSCKLEGINFNATLSGGTKLTITNSMYQNCETVVNKAVTHTSAAPALTRPVGGASLLAYAAYAAGVALCIALYVGVNNHNHNNKRRGNNEREIFD